MGLLNFGDFNITTFCDQMSGTIQIVGYVLLIVKIAIPLLIIAFGIFDLGKAVVADKEDEIKKSTKRLLYRVVAGLAIFLIADIIIFLFQTFSNEYKENEAAFSKCITCFRSPGSCK